MTSINQALTTREAIQSWLLDFHESTATLDAKYCTERFFTPDIELQYANNPVVSGREDATDFFDKAFRALDSMSHEIVYFDFVAPDKVYQAATIKYVVKGDDQAKDMIEIPAMMTVWLREDQGRLRIRKSEIYLDASRLFTRMNEKGLI